jgi:hypothetical protein
MQTTPPGWIQYMLTNLDAPVGPAPRTCSQQEPGHRRAAAHRQTLQLADFAQCFPALGCGDPMIHRAARWRGSVAHSPQVEIKGMNLNPNVIVSLPRATPLIPSRDGRRIMDPANSLVTSRCGRRETIIRPVFDQSKYTCSSSHLRKRPGTRSMPPPPAPPCRSLAEPTHRLPKLSECVAGDSQTEWTQINRLIWCQSSAVSFGPTIGILSFREV